MDIILRSSHVVPDRIQSLRVLAALRDAEVSPRSGGCRVFLRVAVLALHHVDRDPLGIRVGGIEGDHRLCARVVPSDPAVGDTEAAVRHFLVAVRILRDVLGDVALLIELSNIGQPLSGALGCRAVLHVAALIDNPLFVVRVIIGLDPRPEGTEVVAVAAEAVGVVLAVAVRVILGKRAHDLFKLIDRGRNLKAEVVEPVLTDPENLAGGLCNVARDSVDRAGIIGREEQRVRVHLVVVVADVRVLVHVRRNVNEQASIDPLLILRVHAPPPDGIRQIVGSHDELDLGSTVRIAREDVQRNVHVVHLLEPLLDFAVRLLVTIHDREGQVHGFRLVQDIDRLAGISRLTVAARRTRAGIIRRSGVSAVAAARCKQANTQSQREDKADDFLHVHDENSFPFLII